MMAPPTDVLVQDHGTIVLFLPVTDPAREWIAENISQDAQWFGPSLVVEHRFAPGLLEGMIAGGLHAAEGA